MGDHRDITTLGYVRDAYVELFKPPASTSRHPPLVHRGYWARTTATRTLCDAFARECGEERFNVVNVGCGYDTLAMYVLDAHGAKARVVEVDHAEVIGRKRAKCERSEAWRAATTSGAYAAVACDVRDLEAVENVFKSDSLAFDWSLPTLVVAECVLAYLPEGKSSELVGFFGARVERGAFVAYDPIEPDDAFGQQMMKNVNSRGCAFAGIRDAPNVRGAIARYVENGWKRGAAYDMNQVYARLDANERARIERIERFDEFEEWRLIMAHYCVSFAVNGGEGFLAGFDLGATSS